MRTNYETDAESFPHDYYKVAGWGDGIAFYVLGWETAPDDETEWTGYESRTGRVLVVMVGDDAQHSVDESDLSRLDEDEFCHGCGQIGCGH